MCPSPHLWFLHAKHRILDQNFKSLWVPVLIRGFCIPNSEFWPRITSLYGSQTSPALLCNQNGLICTRISSLYWFQPTSVVFACKTAWLASESLVSIGPSPHVWFWMQNSDFWTRITNLYGSQTSPVVLCMQYSVISNRVTYRYGSQPLSVVLAFKTATFGTE